MCRPGTRVIPLGGRTTCITSRPRSPVGAVRCGSRRRRARNSGRATPSLRHEPGVALSSWSTLHFHPVRRAAKDGVATLSDLVRSSLRLRPDRIPVGEVRGAEALDLLKAWGTGHPGGIGTIHAGTALGALRRLEQLIQEAVITVPRALIAETINLVAVLAGRGADRRLAELALVTGLGPAGDYDLSSTGD